MNDKDRTDLRIFLFPDQGIEHVMLDRIQTASTLERVCRLSYKEKEKTKDFCLLIHKDKILAYCINNPAEAPCELNNRVETESFCFELFECESKKGTFPHGIPALLMSKKKLEELKKNTDFISVQQLSECLASETGDDIHSSSFARVLKYLNAEGELRFCTFSDTGWEFQYATFMSECSNGWLIRMSSDATKDWIIALPITKGQLCGSINDWILESTSLSKSE